MFVRFPGFRFWTDGAEGRTVEHWKTETELIWSDHFVPNSEPLWKGKLPKFLNRLWILEEFIFYFLVNVRASSASYGFVSFVGW